MPDLAQSRKEAPQNALDFFKQLKSHIPTVLISEEPVTVFILTIDMQKGRK